MTPRSGLNKTALSAALSPKGRNATGWEQAASRADVPLSAALSPKGRNATGLGQAAPREDVPLSAALSPKGRNATGWEQAAPREDVPLSAAFSLKGRSACRLRAWQPSWHSKCLPGKKSGPVCLKAKAALPQTGRGKTVSRLPGSRQFLRRHAVHDGGADAVDEIMQIVDILEQIQPLRLGFHCALQ